MSVQDVSKTDVASLLAQIEALRAENESMKLSKVNAKSAIKISTKGAVSVYGMGKFPVTLYPSQWAQLFTKIEDIKAFIEANKELLTDKRAA